MYDKLNAEVKQDILEANSIGEVKTLLDSQGFTVDDEEAEKILRNVHKERLAEAEISLEEMELITGGARDYVQEGCAATVEPGSRCNTNDNCALTWVTYINKVSNWICQECGADLGQTHVHEFICPRCHTVYTDRNGRLERMNWWGKSALEVRRRKRGR